MASDNRSLLDMLHGQGGQGGHGGQGAQGGQGSQGGQAHGQGFHPQQHMQQHQQQQQQPMEDRRASRAMDGRLYHNFDFFEQSQSMGPMGPMGPTGQMGPMGPMAPMDSGHAMDQRAFMQLMGQPPGPHMAPFPQGPPPPSRPPPHGNALASLLQSLNQPFSPPAESSAPAFSAPSQQQQPQPMSQTHTPPSQANLQASTESLKLALFGGVTPKQESTSAQQKTEDLKMALFGAPRPDLAQPQPSPMKEEVNLLAMLQKSSSSSSPAPQPLSEAKVDPSSEHKSLGGRRDSTPKPVSSKETTPQSSSKSKFTYVNPFHSFTSTANASTSTSAPSAVSAAPAATHTSQSRTSTPIAGSQDHSPAEPSSKRSSMSTPVPRRETPTHAEAEAGGRPHEHGQKRYQLDQLLPPHSAWNHRVQKLAKGSSSVPDGVYLSHPGSEITIYDTGLVNSDAIFSEDLETIPITLIPTDVEYNHGRMVAVSKGYISYAAKGGKIRVIQQSHGHRTLLRGHTDQVIDMGFSSVKAQEATGLQLLASVGKDSKVIIWDLSGSDVDSTDIAHSKYLELIGTPHADQPRYSRIAWSPTHPSHLALVNNDEHSVIIVNIHNLVASQADQSPVVNEAQLLPHSRIIQAHDQAINDISFSRDGSVLITASEDGSVKFWDLSETATAPVLLNEIIPHGGLGVTNAMFVDQPDTSSVRCIVTACRRGTELSLWHISGTGPLDQFVFKEPPSSGRRSSLGKSASRLQDLRMFNFMGYDCETASLVLANSARLSLFGLKLKVSQTLENGGLSSDLDQAALIRASMAQEKTSCSAGFDFMIEYPMPQPVVSFVVMPDSSLEYNGFSVYCIQAKAVQQYIIKGLEPHDKQKCHTFVSAPPAAKPAELKAKAGPKASAIKVLDSAQNKTSDGTESSGLIKTEKIAAESVTPTPITQSENQEREPEKSIKLHGPVINGAIAKLKEKKRSSAADNQGQPELGADKKESPKMPTPGRMGRKSSQDTSPSVAQTEGFVSKKGPSPDARALADAAKPSGRNSRQQANRNQEISDVGLAAMEQTPLSSSSGAISMSASDLQSMLQAMEDKIASRLEKKLSLELEQQYRKMDQDQIARQEVVLKMVSQTLAKNTEQLLVQTVSKEIQNSVIPSLNKIVGAAVERQLARTINEATLKAMPSAVETAVKENVEKVMGGKEFMDSLTTKVASTIRPSVEDSFKESFTKVLIPSYQKATQVMFQQIHTAFQSGIEDLSSANQKDHESIEVLSASARKIASNVDLIQTSLAQVAQAQSEQFAGNQPRPDQQRRSVASGLQRALQAEDGTGYGSRRASQQTSPVESKQTAAINQLIAYGDFEAAFTQALSINEANAVIHICSKVSPRAVFQQTSANPSGTLSQPVLLALTHHLANQELSQNLGARLSWLQEILMRLDSKDPLLRDHMNQILPLVQKRLEATYAELANSGDTSPQLHTLQLLLRYVHSMQL
ncbi:G-type lectin S-receptor-like serine/threonine-protein kinase SRK [Mortierella alpina]|nr:G-type lectin S-receptor-like serine/threonine-protein kinase SRK [Mortierella alpina]